MKKLILFCVLCVLCARSFAGLTNETATITVTNAPTGTNGESITFQGFTYVWTNATPGYGYIAVDSANGASGDATNLFNQLANDWSSSLIFKQTGSTAFTIRSYPNGVISISNYLNWMTYSIATNSASPGTATSLIESNFTATSSFTLNGITITSWPGVGGAATNVFFGSTANIIWTTSNGTNYFTVPSSTFDAFGLSAAVQVALNLTNTLIRIDSTNNINSAVAGVLAASVTNGDTRVTTLLNGLHLNNSLTITGAVNMQGWDNALHTVLVVDPTKGAIVSYATPVGDGQYLTNLNVSAQALNKFNVSTNINIAGTSQESFYTNWIYLQGFTNNALNTVYKINAAGTFVSALGNGYLVTNVGTQFRVEDSSLNILHFINGSPQGSWADNLEGGSGVGDWGRNEDFSATGNSAARNLALVGTSISNGVFVGTVDFTKGTIYGGTISNANITSSNISLSINSGGASSSLFLADYANLGMGGTASSPVAEFYYNPGHSQSPETQFGFNDSFAFAPGQGNNGTAVGQFGTALATHDQFFFQADNGIDNTATPVPNWNTNYAPSKTVQWLTATNFGAGNTSHTYLGAGVRAEYNPNSGNAELVVLNPVSHPLRIIQQSNDVGVAQVYFKTNGVFISNTLAVSNGVTVGIKTDPNAAQYFTIAGTLTATEQAKVNTLVLAAKQHGYWSKLIALYPFRGGSAAAMKWNVVNTNTFPITFSGTAFYTNGLTLDIGGSGNTGIIPASSFQSKSNQMGFVWINNTNVISAAGAPFFLGSTDGGNSSYWGLGETAGGFADVFPPNATAASATGAIGQPAGNYIFTGLYAQSVTNSYSVNIWINGQQYGGPASITSPVANGDTVAISLGALSTNVNYLAAGAGTNFLNSDFTNLVADLTAFQSGLNYGALNVAGAASISGDANVSGGINIGGAALASSISVGTCSVGTLTASSNNAAYANVLSPSPALALATSWTNNYGARIGLTIDGALNMAVSGTTTLTLTNLTTSESHIIAGSTLSIAGTTYFSYSCDLSTNDIIQVIAANTGTATTTITKATVRIK